MTNDRASASSRGYGHRWRRFRITFLREHPLCRMCEAEGRLTPAEVVDHVIPHKGDEVLFWSEANWQSLCKPCHDGAKQRQELGLPIKGCDANGIPLDPNSPWNR